MADFENIKNENASKVDANVSDQLMDITNESAIDTNSAENFQVSKLSGDQNSAELVDTGTDGAPKTEQTGDEDDKHVDQSQSAIDSIIDESDNQLSQQSENQPEEQESLKVKSNETAKKNEKENDEEEEEERVRKKAKFEEPEYIKVRVKAQYMEKMITVEATANLEQLRSLVAVKFNILVDQVCLTLDGKMLKNDNDDLKSLNIIDGTSLHLAVKYNLGNQSDPNSVTSPWFLPSQYTKLGLNNVNFVQLQQQMQQQMMANPEMVREMMANPLVQQLMQNPEVMKKMMMQVPQTREMLNRHPDIFDALNNPDVMKQSLEIARDPVALQEMLAKMEVPENSPFVNSVPIFNPQPIPTPQTMLRMTAQHPTLLQQMFDSPYYKTMVDGMIANPQWTQQMIVNNPLFANNPQLQQQLSTLMPYYLQQIQNPQLTSLMSNPDSLKALLKIQHGVSVLQSELPNLSQSMGFPNIAIPGLVNSSDNVSSVGGAKDFVGGARGGTDQLDATSLIMAQLVNQMGTGKINLPDEEKYKDELELMKSMGFNDTDLNLHLLRRTLGNVDAAVTYLLHELQQPKQETEEEKAMA